MLWLRFALSVARDGCVVWTMAMGRGVVGVVDNGRSTMMIAVVCIIVLLGVCNDGCWRREEDVFVARFCCSTIVLVVNFCCSTIVKSVDTTVVLLKRDFTNSEKIS